MNETSKIPNNGSEKFERLEDAQKFTDKLKAAFPENLFDITFNLAISIDSNGQSIFLSWDTKLLEDQKLLHKLNSLKGVE
jgi:hypothetical protein